jgi:hypothetical protein
MSSQFDASEFVDDDFQAARKGSAAANPFAAAPGDRAPTREEVDSKVGEMQHKLTELKRAQQDLERERASLEETRRRQLEFTTGRQEMVQQLTRGVGLLEEAEFAARRDAEQMAKTLEGMRDVLIKVQTIQEGTWTKDNFSVELTRALTTVENARLEWNAARLKFPVLSGTATAEAATPPAAEHPLDVVLQQRSYAELCKLGLALTWPLALAALAIFVVLLLRR